MSIFLKKSLCLKFTSLVLLLMISTANANEKQNKLCIESPLKEASFFPIFKDRANQLRADYCTQKKTVFEIQDAIYTAAKNSLTGFKKLNTKDNKLFDVQALAKNLEMSSISMSGLGNFVYQDIFGSSKIDVNFDKGAAISIDKSACTTQVQRLFNKGTCITFLKEYHEIYNFAHQTLASRPATLALQELQKIESEWEQYSENGRSQMPWEMWLNYETWKSSRIAGHFTPPPKHQWILLHPNIVIENVSDAIGGEETQQALMIEVVGYNRWENDKWYQPSGISLVSLYANRSQVKDWGHGIALHFGNDLTIGYSRHDDDNGLFISVDLWKLFSDKKTTLENVRDRR